MAWVREMIGWMSDAFVHDTGPELDRLARQLRAGPVDERLSAVRQLTYTSSTDSVSLLLGAIRDPEARVRAAAASALGYKARRDAVPSVAVLLDDPDSEVRACAVGALDEIGMPRSRNWLRTWRDRIVIIEDADLRIPDLLARALGDRDAFVRSAALAILPRHGAGGVAVALEHLQGRQGVDAAERDAPERELVEALHAHRADHRKAAVSAMHKLYGASAVRPLAEALRDPSPEVRQAAVEAVTALGPRPALDELLSRLTDSDDGVVVKVIEGLVCARNLGAFEPAAEDRIHGELLAVARRRGGRAQGLAAWALGELGRVESVSTLCDLLDEPSEDVVVGACEALGKINDPRAVAPLLAVLDRGEALPKVWAARALARAGDVRAVPVLVRCLFAETRPEVDCALEEAYAALCGSVEEAARPALESADPEVRIQALRRAISEPRLALALVRQLLETPDDRVRAAGLEVLSKQGYDMPALARSTLTLPDKSEARRILAINLLATLRPEESVPLLDGLLSDQNEPPEVYRHAVLALKRVGSASAKAALKARIEDSREAVRGWVREALA